MGQNSDLRSVETKRIDRNMIKVSLPAIAPPPHHSRRRAVIIEDPKRMDVRFGEIAGGKMAECAAIFCCCPCGLANLFFLAAVRLPAGLCCRAVQKRILIRRAKKKAKLFDFRSGSNSGCSDGSSKSESVEDRFVEFTGTQGSVVMVIGDAWPARSPTVEVVEVEKEVWSKFCGRGFWRSFSQKDDL